MIILHIIIMFFVINITYFHDRYNDDSNKHNVQIQVIHISYHERIAERKIFLGRIAGNGNGTLCICVC